MIVGKVDHRLRATMESADPPHDARNASDSLNRLEAIIADLNAARLFVVADAGAFEFSGAKSYFAEQLQDVDMTFFSDFEPNPKLEDVERGVLACRDCEPDAVIAIGGGTAIDLAKMISVFAANDASCHDLAIGAAAISKDAKRLPFVAIPTTAGTGSEATHFAVVYVSGEKYSVADQSLLPDVVIVDPQLTESLPSSITAATGLDAFCQAIESMWAVGATEESMIYAEEAARLAFDNLATAVHAPTPDARAKMCRASHLAGKAINISKTTLPHAMSYAITADYGVPHGQAVAMLLAAALQFNADIDASDCLDPRGVEQVRNRIARVQNVLGAANVGEACQLIREFVRSLGCSASPAEAGIESNEAFARIATKVNVVRLGNNPRKTTPAILAQLLAE